LRRGFDGPKRAQSLAEFGHEVGVLLLDRRVIRGHTGRALSHHFANDSANPGRLFAPVGRQNGMRVSHGVVPHFLYTI